MKIRLVAILFLVFSILISSLVYAHPGRTDGSGGHTDRSTGEYHYHHGYDDHQHYDIDGDGFADCPYNFKDNTIHKDSSTVKDEQKKDSSSSNYRGSFTDEYNRLRKLHSEDVSQSVSAKKKNINIEEVIDIALVIIFFGPLILYVFISIMVAFYIEVRDLIQKLKKK